MYYIIVDNLVNSLFGVKTMAKNGSIPLKQSIHRQTRHEIIFGKVAPGERITENRLTEKFQCSRGPVREALIQLEREGFVNNTSRKNKPQITFWIIQERYPPP